MNASIVVHSKVHICCPRVCVRVCVRCVCVRMTLTENMFWSIYMFWTVGSLCMMHVLMSRVRTVALSRRTLRCRVVVSAQPSAENVVPGRGRGDRSS